MRESPATWPDLASVRLEKVVGIDQMHARPDPNFSRKWARTRSPRTRLSWKGPLTPISVMPISLLRRLVLRVLGIPHRRAHLGLDVLRTDVGDAVLEGLAGDRDRDRIRDRAQPRYRREQ